MDFYFWYLKSLSAVRGGFPSSHLSGVVKNRLFLSWVILAPLLFVLSENLFAVLCVVPLPLNTSLFNGSFVVFPRLLIPSLFVGCVVLLGLCRYFFFVGQIKSLLPIAQCNTVLLILFNTLQLDIASAPLPPKTTLFRSANFASRITIVLPFLVDREVRFVF